MSRDSLRTMLGSAMGLRLAMAALNFGLFWLLSHRLSTEALGGFSLLMNLFLVVQVLPLLGLSMPLVRRVASERDQVAIEMSNALVIALPVALLLALVLVTVGWQAYPPEMAWPFALLAASVLPGAWTLVAESTLLGLERMAVIARVQFCEAAARVVGAVLVVETGHGLVGVFAVVLVLRVLIAVVYLLLPVLPKPRWALVSAALWRRNRGEIPIFFGISLLATVSSRLDVIVLSRVQGLQEVGVYAAAARLYDAALMLPTVAALVMMPTLARLFVSDTARFGELLVLALRGSLAVGALIALAVAALAQPLIHLLYPAGMGVAAGVLRWLIFAAVLMTADQILSSTMIAAKAQAEDMKALARGAVVLAVGLLLLAWTHGPLGASVAVVIAQVCRVSLRVRWAAGALALPGLWRDWWRQLASCATGAAGLWAVFEQRGTDAWFLGWLVAWSCWALMARLTGVVGPAWPTQLRAAILAAQGRVARRFGSGT